MRCRAGAVYLGLAVLGEVCLLMGFVLLAAATPGSSLAIRDAVALLPTSPWRDATLAFLIVGFGLKVGLVPLHVWLPLAYPAAPIPAAAVISGAISKAGVIGLLRFLPLEAALPDWGAALAAVGLVSAFYGVAVGITQANPKTVLAYSSVSQMGFIATVLGMALAAGNGGATMAAAFYAAHHVLAKGALFLAVGVARRAARADCGRCCCRRRWWRSASAGCRSPAACVAKLAVKPPLGDGHRGPARDAGGGGQHAPHAAFPAPSEAGCFAGSAGHGAARARLALAGDGICCRGGPWTLFLIAGIGTLADALAPSALWAALWPVLLGGVLAVGLRRFGHHLPRVPEGDIVVLGAPLARAGIALGAMLERTEGVLRQWPVAGMSLLALAALLGAAILGQAR